MSSLTGILDMKIEAIAGWAQLLIYVAILIFMVAIAFWRKWLTRSGLGAAFFVGLFTLYLGGFSAFSILLFFFISGSLLAKVVKKDNPLEKKSNKRDAFQVLANSLPALIALLLYRYSGHPIASIVAFSSSLSEALADTWSGDIGRLSNKDTVSIITFTKVPKGISGGVTPLGFLAGFIASMLVALLHIGTFGYHLYSSFITVLFTGFLGSVLDSILGATVQVHYRDKNGCLTEKSESDGEKLERVRGIPFIDNDVVNLISGLFSMTLSFSLGVLVF